MVLPAGDAVVFVTRTPESSTLAVVPLEDGAAPQRLDLVGSYPRYAASGHLVYAADGGLYAAGFDPERRELTSSAVPVVDGVAIKASGGADFDVAQNGSLAYVSDVSRASGVSRSLVWVDREGAATPLTRQRDDYWYPRVSPDGQRVAVAVNDGSDVDLWVLDVERETRTRLTFGGDNRYYPIWTPDGSRLTYADNNTNRIVWTPTGGTGDTTPLLGRDSDALRDVRAALPTSWSPDGTVLAFYVDHPETGRDIWIVPVAPDGTPGTPEAFLVTPFQERGATFSPDGQWLAFVSNKSGQNEVYVRPYPGPGDEFTISSGGGQEPTWSPDGRELFYRRGEADVRCGG